MKRLFLTLFVTLFVCCCSLNGQVVFTAEVSHILDGDTVDFLHSDGVSDRLRLSGVDAPEVARSSKEISQPYGEKCKKILQLLIDDKTVTIEAKPKRDRYGRLLGRILYGDVDIGLLTLQSGCAWSYYPNGIAKELREKYLTAFTAARANKVGLFAHKRPITPSVWRKKKHLRRQPKKF